MVNLFQNNTIILKEEYFINMTEFQNWEFSYVATICLTKSKNNWHIFNSIYILPRLKK